MGCKTHLGVLKTQLRSSIGLQLMLKMLGLLMAVQVVLRFCSTVYVGEYLIDGGVCELSSPAFHLSL